jgi:high-affinity Fe2+/Pb2+ permease
MYLLYHPSYNLGNKLYSLVIQAALVLLCFGLFSYGFHEVVLHDIITESEY